MTSRKRLLALAAAGLALALPLSAQAHRAWMVPSFTVMSGESAWVSVDAAISNELFYADHRPMRLDSVVVLTPDGSPEKLQNAQTAQYRSTFDVKLSKPGTYKIVSATSSVQASGTENGEGKRFQRLASFEVRDITTRFGDTNPDDIDIEFRHLFVGFKDIAHIIDRREALQLGGVGSPHSAILRNQLSAAGFRIAEAYPHTHATSEADKFHGTLSMYQQAGFQIHADQGEGRLVVRKVL